MWKARPLVSVNNFAGVMATFNNRVTYSHLIYSFSNGFSFHLPDRLFLLFNQPVMCLYWDGKWISSENFRHCRNAVSFEKPVCIFLTVFCSTSVGTQHIHWILVVPDTHLIVYFMKLCYEIEYITEGLLNGKKRSTEKTYWLGSVAIVTYLS